MTIAIRNPCAVRFEALEPRDEGRYCGDCDKVVVDFSRFTERQAQQRIADSNGRLCLALRMDARTHEPIFRPEPARAPHWLGGIVAVAALTAGCAGSSSSGAAAEIVAEAHEEPDDPGPPMTPVDALALAALPPAPTTHAVPLDELGEPEQRAQPDAMQRRLTRRKNQPTHCALPQGPGTYMLAGGI